MHGPSATNVPLRRVAALSLIAEASLAPREVHNVWLHALLNEVARISSHDRREPDHDNAPVITLIHLEVGFALSQTSVVQWPWLKVHHRAAPRSSAGVRVTLQVTSHSPRSKQRWYIGHNGEERRGHSTS